LVAIPTARPTDTTTQQREHFASLTRRIVRDSRACDFEGLQTQTGVNRRQPAIIAPRLLVAGTHAAAALSTSRWQHLLRPPRGLLADLGREVDAHSEDESARCGLVDDAVLVRLGQALTRHAQRRARRRDAA